MAHVLAKDLRDAVLQAAVEGKLSKKEKSDSKIDELLNVLIINPKLEKAEIPYDIPDHWAWVQIGNLGETNDTKSFADGPFGSNLKKEHQTLKPEVRIVQLSNIGENGWKNDNVKYTTYEHLKTIARCEVVPGDFVIAKMMPAGRTIIIPDLETKVTLGSDAVKFVPNKILNKKYLLLSMKSNCFISQVYSEVHGITRVRTSLNKIKNYFLPIPPIEEQARIVAKVDELMAKIDEYEKLENELVELKKNFPGDMKAAVLQAAIEGKLTDSLNTDSDFLSKYQKINITNDDVSIKPNWVLTRVKNIATHQNGKAFKPTDWKQSGLKIIRIQNLTNDKAPANYCDKEIVEDKFLISNNDVLVSWSCTIDAFRYTGETAVLNQHIFKVIFDKVEINDQYYIYAIKSLLSIINNQRHGSTMTHITKKDYENLLFPLPPIEEQQRIVEKLDKLLPICDALCED